ncbi:hypothetical protein X753_28945 [Mesorhizobium sp. LNJC399B00]|nr:hypothetical protein X753_28945 [Mesorhizobium sp. LNJC399B00]
MLAHQVLSAMKTDSRAFRHPRAKQGAQRRSADPRIHSVTSPKVAAAQKALPLRPSVPPIRPLKRLYIFTVTAAVAQFADHGMDPRVSATELRSCFALG